MLKYRKLKKQHSAQNISTQEFDETIDKILQPNLSEGSLDKGQLLESKLNLSLESKKIEKDEEVKKNKFEKLEQQLLAAKVELKKDMEEFLH